MLRVGEPTGERTTKRDQAKVKQATRYMYVGNMYVYVCIHATCMYGIITSRGISKQIAASNSSTVI